MVIFSMPALFVSTSDTAPLLIQNIRLASQEKFPFKLRLSPSVIAASSLTTAKDFLIPPLLDIHLPIDRIKSTQLRLFLSLCQLFSSLINTVWSSIWFFEMTLMIDSSDRLYLQGTWGDSLPFHHLLWLLSSVGTEFFSGHESSPFFLNLSRAGFESSMVQVKDFWCWSKERNQKHSLLSYSKKRIYGLP